ncbi:unnamed protein product [Rhizoctonia solani]|uniref:GCN5-related N-acetyltransferase Rv2170-like domain-containing protein n=1 Tax=Rhizoctonia solani TaxID=456999 RepID=A0A8H3B1A0_9AGAM|nr:unnamed protein product [Rhizoctonia solani]
MPALNNIAPTYDVCVHTSASDFLEAAEHALLADQERRSNLILAHALERASWEATHVGIGASAATLALSPQERAKVWWARRYSPGQPTVEVGRDFWVTCWTIQTPVMNSARQSNSAPVAHALRPPTLDFAVSILASDPIFVFTPHSAASLSSRFLAPRAGLLVQRLAQYMPVGRMSRLFALFPVAETIADAWTAHTGVPRAAENQCVAFSTFCTVATFAGVHPLPDGHRVVLAGTSQIPHIARMYYDFETELALHPITSEQARQKVERMVQQRQMWLYEYPVYDASKTRVEYYDICAIAALTRHTPAVAAISSIYTVPFARGRGIAELLVGRICNDVFAMNKSAVLFVPQGNTTASNLLGRIGFYGMGPRAVLGEVAETWREIGFVGGARVSGGW